MHLRLHNALTLACSFQFGSQAAALPHDRHQECRKTQVAILGAGVAGITAAQALHEQSVTDFVIVERNDHIGGRVLSTKFGQKPDGSPYTVELGANWVHGPGEPGGPENPIWTLAKKYDLSNTVTDPESVITYDETGAVDYVHLIHENEDALATASSEAGEYLSDNLQDVTVRTGLSMAGWKPHKDMHAQAVDWFVWDFEAAMPPEDSSLVFGIAGVINATYNHFSDADHFVWDQRGFNTFILGEAREFLEEQDPRLLLNTTVTAINYSDNTVKIHFNDGGCVETEHAICTFSLGVLQSDVVEYHPELPDWKQEAIESFKMGTYTKIFMQFNESFWDSDTQFFLYADPHERGRYPVFQSLTGSGFFEGSNILFVTVTGQQSYVVEEQSDEAIKAEILDVLRHMFPDRHIPDPTAFLYPRWSMQEWAFGSFSNWPVGVTLERHQNLRANVGRLWFAGEATSTQYFGYLQGAWYEGQEAGQRVARVLAGDIFGDEGALMQSYETLHGTTNQDQYDEENGWYVDTLADE